MTDDDRPGLERFVNRYPPAEMTPSEFEGFTGELLGALASEVENLRVTHHELIEGVDGSFDFDATLRYRLAGLDFLVVVEAKQHRNPIKREVVQVLHAKAVSVGAQKAVLISTAPFQAGAVEFAKVHGVALVLVTEGRFTYETRAATPGPRLSRQEARELFDIATFVGVHIGAGDKPESTMISVIDPDDPTRVGECLLAPLPSDPRGKE